MSTTMQVHTERPAAAFGSRVLGAGVIAMSLVCLAWGDFDPGQPVPRALPHREALASVAAAYMLVCGAAIEWRRTSAAAAGALAVYFVVIVVGVMNGRLLFVHGAEFGVYSGAAEQLAIGAAALIVHAEHAVMDEAWSTLFQRIGTRTFGLCAVLFGVAHFVYLNLTTPLVPTWLPPTQAFWAYATGVAQIVAGVAILGGIHARLAALLLTAMYGSFTFLVHLPMLFADASSRMNWSENALNIALVGAAWVVFDTASKRRQAAQSEMGRHARTAP